MHPTFSIVLFTTAAGAGFGLLFLLGLGAPLWLLPPDSLFGLAGLGTALVFAVGGLASSVFHLGRPERAWRAFSQWRSSWLSRMIRRPPRSTLFPYTTSPISVVAVS